MDLLSLLKSVCAFSRANILSGFAAADLIPLKPERVLAKLNIKIKTPTPPFFQPQQILLFRKNTNQSLSIELVEKADLRSLIIVSILGFCRAARANT